MNLQHKSDEPNALAPGQGTPMTWFNSVITLKASAAQLGNRNLASFEPNPESRTTSSEPDHELV